MAPRKKTREPAFTSLRIIGEKAQHLLTKAADMRRKQKPAEKKTADTIAETDQSLTIRLSLTNVAQAALVVLAVVVGAAMVVSLRDKIIMLLLAFFAAAIMDPGVRRLENIGFPRGIGILLHYVVALFVFLFLLFSLIPIIASQLQQIALLITDQVNRFLTEPSISLPLITDEVNRNLTNIVESTLRTLSIDQFTDALEQISENMTAIAQGSVLFATRLAGSVVGFFVRLVVVLVLAFFIQMEKERLRTWFRSFFAADSRSYVDYKTDAVHLKIGQWARGQLLLGLAIGLLVYIALTILGIPYAATLAVLAGFTEFIPYVGPLIAAIPAVLISLTEGDMLRVIIVAGVYYVIQWCENNFLVPLIMKRAVGLSPIAVIFAMLVGLSFPTVIHPVIGMLVAVPVTTIIALFLEDLRAMRSGAA